MGSNGESQFTVTKTLIFQIIGIVALLSIPSLLYTGSYIVSDAPAPKEGLEPAPNPDQRLSEGLLFIVLDGSRKDMMKDSSFMPNLNAMVDEKGTYIDVLTGPLTMTASCVKEMATGIPSRPNEGLNNFHPEHPGTPDGWTLASSYDGDGDGIADNEFAIVGDYVWGDLYADNDDINFMKHRYGHSDYMQGDTESFETMNSWFDGEIPESNTKEGVTFDRTPNVIVAHLSGLDSTGHRYGSKDSPEYEDKLLWLDGKFTELFAKVPENWTVVVTADHGLTDSGQHGSPDEVIREVGAWMWGPNIKQSHVVEKQIDQRDLATLPSLLLSLPLPHAIHAKFPLDALNVSEEEKQVLDQWNWNATVERNQWMEDNGHHSIEGLSSEVIEWEKISSEKMGLRTADLVLSGLFFVMICISIMYLLRKNGLSLGLSLGSGAVITAVTAVSTIIAYNQSTALDDLYYPMGLITPYFVVGFSLYLLINKNEKHTRRIVYALLASIVLMLTFIESRFSSLGLILLVMLFLPMFTKVAREKQTSRVLKLVFVLVLIPALFLSHYRGIGFSLPRMMTFFSFKVTLASIVYSSCFMMSATYIFVTRNKTIQKQSHRAAVTLGFTSIPILMSLENNVVDWILLLGILGTVIYGFVLKYTKPEQASDLIPLAVFFWLAMSWGGWVLAASMVMYAAVESFLQKEWTVLHQKYDSIHQEFARIVLVTLLPLVTWFTWWAALGQIDGIGHPRDVDPGNLFLNGGYIGDRFSPSNAWVGFMGGGPPVAMTVLWWSLFHKNNWPVHYVALLLVLRISLISLQLSLAPNLPRFIFKISWDIIFALGLLAMMSHILISSYREHRNVPIAETV